MAKCNEALTDEQKELVAKNHDLIYSFAHKMSISIDEYYDVLAIGLCKAAKTFDKNKGAFSTFVYRCMENELRMYWKEIQKKSAIPEYLVVSYESKNVRNDEDNQNSFLDVFTDWQSYNDMVYDTMVSDIKKKLTDKENVIFEHLLNGLAQNEITKALECTQQNVSFIVSNIRKKVLDYLNYS